MYLQEFRCFVCTVKCMSVCCKKKTIKKADLGALCTVSAVGTKGQFPKFDKDGHAVGRQSNYVQKYRLFYRKNDVGDWLPLGFSIF